MRSNSTESDSKRSTKGSKSRLPLALTAIVAVFALATAADAAQRMGSSGGFAGMAGGFGGRMGGFGGKLGSGGGTISAITGVPGRPGGKLTKGGTTGSDGGRPSAGNHGKDRPHKPRFPKGPIIVGVPTGGDRCHAGTRRGQPERRRESEPRANHRAHGQRCAARH
jgi:hypothetical protein